MGGAREQVSVGWGKMFGSAVSLVVVMSLKGGTLVSRYARADYHLLNWSTLAYFRILVCHTREKDSTNCWYISSGLKT